MGKGEDSQPSTVRNAIHLQLTKNTMSNETRADVTGPVSAYFQLVRQPEFAARGYRPCYTSNETRNEKLKAKMRHFAGRSNRRHAANDIITSRNMAIRTSSMTSSDGVTMRPAAARKAPLRRLLGDMHRLS